MTDSLERLFHTTDVKAFATLFQETQEQYQNPRAYLGDVVAYLPVRLYEHYYQDSVPHSFFGLIAALQASESLFSEESRWHPLAQQSWFVTKERKRNPLQVETISASGEGDPETRWQRFQAASDSGDFQEAMASAKGFLNQDPDRSLFRQRSLAYALEDSFLGGHKFVYLCQAWSAAETLDWIETEKILSPALHFLVVAPKESSLSVEVRDFWKDNPLGSPAHNNGELSQDGYNQMEVAVLFARERAESLAAVKVLAEAGCSFETAREALLLSAAQALANAQAGQWIWPMRAFHWLYHLAHLREDQPQQRSLALLIGAALLNQASARSRRTEGNRQLDEVTHHISPAQPFAVLRSVVSHTDPYASATAALAILGMGETERNQLFENLASLAVKNDGQMCYGHDLLFVHETARSYQQVRLDEKDKLPLSAAFFLGRVQKQYQLFGAYKG